MMSVLPKLRTDLTVARWSTPAGTTYVVKNPSTGAFFWLGEVEHFIAERCDGVSTVDVVRRDVEQQFDASLPPESLERFVATLDRAGLLETGEREPRGRNVWARLLGNPLYFRMP